MYHVRDLDSRHRISTGSEKLAREFWNAIIESGGTPIATRSAIRVSF